MQLLIIA